MNHNGDSHLREFGEFCLDTSRKILWCGGEVVSLPLKTVELLCVLVENQGQVVSNNELLDKIWEDSFVEESVLTQNIYLLRKTLRNGGGKDLIKNVPRRGYMLNTAVTAPNGNGHAGAKAVTERRVAGSLQGEQIDRPVEKQKPEPHKRIVKPNLRSRSKIAAAGLFIVVLTVLTGGALYYFRGSPLPQPDGSFSPLRSGTTLSPSAVKTLAIVTMQGADSERASKFTKNLSIRVGSINKFKVRPFVYPVDSIGIGASADFVLEGEMGAAGRKFASSVRLLDTRNGAVVWTERFEFDNLVQLEDATASAVTRQIIARMTPIEQEAVSKRLPTNFDAYINYQNGHALWRSRKDGSAYFRKAIEQDQSFAAAYSMMANIKATGGVRGSYPAREAKELLDKAFQLDENLSDAYAVQGFMQIFHDYDWEGAETSLRSALALDANNVNAHHWLGVYYSINRRLEEAKSAMMKALEIDPTNPTILADIGQLHYFAGENDLAAEYCRKALAVDAGHDFAKHYQRIIARSSAPNDRAGTLAELRAASETNAFTLPYINVDPRYADVREHADFRSILKRVNLAD